MESTRTWILLANHTDPSLMRNKLTYDLARGVDLAYSPESRFVDVKINDVDGEHDLGNYLLTEKTEVRAHPGEPARIRRASLLELDQNYGTAEPFYFTTATSQRIFVLKDAPGGVGRHAHRGPGGWVGRAPRPTSTPWRRRSTRHT